MRALVKLLLALLHLCSLDYGTAFYSLQSYLYLKSIQMPRRLSHQAPGPQSIFLTPSEPPLKPVMLSMSPAPAPAHARRFQGSAHSPTASKHHRTMPHARPSKSFYPPLDRDCGHIICTEPLTTTPFDSPCGCVVPMQVELDLGVAPFRVFSVVAELALEVAAGIYMKQSQVRIVGAAASCQDQVKTRVDFDLVPLGEKFDNVTALLTYERLWKKKVPLNASIFGDYEVVFVRYPGLPSLPPLKALGPRRSKSYQNPFTANVPISENKKWNPRIMTLVALSSFIFVLIALAIFFIRIKWMKLRGPSIAVRTSSTSNARQTGFGSNVSSRSAGSTSLSPVSTIITCAPSVKAFSLAELESATDKFSSERLLGEGGFGRVYNGALVNGFEVAIKLLSREHRSGDREFISEVGMLCQLNHRNLVKLIGICIDGRTRCLVYEFIQNGSVESHLHGADRTRGPLEWNTRLKIALGAARGLAYLHEDSNPCVVHCDFKASNVLLEDDFTPKVSDFGLARDASEGIQHISSRFMGTFGYVAPEYAMTGHLLVKSDVYSFGVVLLELLSGRMSVDNRQPQGQENLVSWARPLLTSRRGLERLVDPSLAGDYDFDDMARVAAIASLCVHPEVLQRPFMGEVVQALKLVSSDPAEICDVNGEPGAGGSWWDAGTPRRSYGGLTSSFTSIERSSGPAEDMARRGESPARENRSAPLRTGRRRSGLSGLRGIWSENEVLFRRFGGWWRG